MRSAIESPQQGKDSRKITNFFKGIAILLVILVHSHQVFDLTLPQSAVQRFGQMGCQVFFVLSSFGLCHSFSKKVPGWFSHIKKRLSGLAIGWWGAIALHLIYRILVAVLLKKDVLGTCNFPGMLINALFLNGLVPVAEINNIVVRGGWYVGTTVILYALFPVLYKVYFSNGHEIWKKHRPAIFSSVIFLITALIVIVSENVHPLFACENNSFVYFSFINQLTSFSLGIVLFDLVNNRRPRRVVPYLSLGSFVVSVALFYGGWRYSFVFCPSFVAASFMLLFWCIMDRQTFCDKIDGEKNLIIKTIHRFGSISFPIYLTHSFVVYDLSVIFLKLLRPVCNNEFVWYLILLPIDFCLVYVVGYVYNKCISLIKTKKTEN